MMGKIQDAIDQFFGLGSRSTSDQNASWWKSHSYTKKERQGLAKSDKKLNPRGDRKVVRGRVEKPMDFYRRQAEEQKRFEDNQRAKQEQHQQNKGDEPRDGKMW